MTAPFPYLDMALNRAKESFVVLKKPVTSFLAVRLPLEHCLETPIVLPIYISWTTFGHQNVDSCARFIQVCPLQDFCRLSLQQEGD